MERYCKNMTTLSLQENHHIQKCKVCVIGCGGLGGYIIEMLGRIGVGFITAVDGDTFESSNLNRQLLSDEDSIGMKKALKAKERMKLINSSVKLNAITEPFTIENGKAILANHDVIVDALDNIKTRLLLEDYCESLELPLVHGAIAGWYGQIITIYPGDRALHNIYLNEEFDGAEKELGNPSFTPPLVASIQVSEVLKILIGRGNLLRNKILYINTLEQEYNVLELG